MWKGKTAQVYGAKMLHFSQKKYSVILKYSLGINNMKCYVHFNHVRSELVLHGVFYERESIYAICKATEKHSQCGMMKLRSRLVLYIKS